MSSDPVTQEVDTPKQGKAGRLFVTIFTLILVSATVAAAFLRQEPFVEELLAKDEWISAVVGNFHPLVLHLPIGIVFLTVMLEMMGWISFGKWKPVTTFGLFLAVVTGCVACITGLVDMLNEPHKGDDLIDHMWAGVGFVAILMLAFFAKIWGRNANGRGFFYAILLFASAGVMGFGAHIAGKRVHGDVFPKIGAAIDAIPEEEKKPIPDRLAYEDVVVPILQAKCYRCHAEGKGKKGGLLMDSFAALIEGGDDEGPSIIPGNAEESPMITRIHLPNEDEYHMPPYKKAKPENQLTDAEKNLLGWWVSILPKGVEEQPEDLSLSALGAPQNILDDVASLVSPEEQARIAKKKADKKARIAAKKKAEREAMSGTVTQLQASSEIGTALNYVAQDSNDLEFTAVSTREKFADDQLRKLLPVASGLTILQLGSTSVTEDGLAEVLPQMTSLKRLNLSNTGISDQLLDIIGGLENLEYLNLYGTEVTDKGLEKLAGLGKLEKLYLWKTKATPEGGAALKAQIPSVEVNFGL